MSDFIGLQYPLIKGPRGLLSQSLDIDVIKADLLQLILTNPGERVMLPDFGIPLRNFIFELNDSILQQNVKNAIAAGIAKWEPRIIIQDIIVGPADSSDLNPLDPGDDLERILKITVNFYNPNNISTVNQLTLEVPLGGN